jgi:two-component system cell cycle response regulator CtrA
MLRERIAALEDLLRGKEMPPIEFGLTSSEGTILALLMARSLVTKDAMLAALYHNSGKEEAESKIADVFICKLRKKLKPFGIQIVTRWGNGWEMPVASKQVVRGLMPESLAA